MGEKPLDHMPKATIQGELHGSQGDNRRLIDHGLENYDQLFIEGRAAIDIRGTSLKFAAFLIGIITLFWIMGIIDRLSQRLARIRSKPAFDIEKKASEVGLAVDNEIDSGFDDIYEEFEGRMAGFAFSSMLLISLSFSYISLRPLIWFNINRVGREHLFNLAIISVHVFTFVLLLGAFFFAGLIVLRSPALDTRDQVMANSIIEESDANEIERVLISCGDKHVPGIARELKNEDWDVDPYRSGHWVSRGSRWLLSLWKRPKDFV